MKINGEMKLEEVTTKEPLKFISAKINESYFEVTESDKSDYFNSERDVFKAIENRNKLNDFIKTIAPYIIMACVAIVVLYSVDTIGIYTNQIGATVSELLKAIGESSTDIVAQGKEVSGELNIPGV
jgi:predicted regulator of amino acid metabolism with ACT domain